MVFALGIAAVVSVTAMNESPGASSQVASTTPAGSSAPQQPVAVAPAPDSSNAASQSAPPSTGVVVQKSDIDQLAAAVKLGTTNTPAVGKEVWARETPVAEKLLNGLCDCDQRNWLIHFVQTGKEAVNGSENYHKSVQFLATLRRNDEDVNK